MEEEAFTIDAKRKKPFSKLASVLSELGFTKVSYAKGKLVVEKSSGEDLSGKPNLEFRITFLEKKIEFIYSIAAKENKNSKLLVLLPTLIDVLEVSEDYYNIQPSAFFPVVNELFADLSKIVDMEALELRTELNELQEKYDRLTSRYDDLVRSSEENTKILLECERKRDELDGRLKKMTGMSDDLLKEELYNWLKVRNGSINVKEFAKTHSIDPYRVEEGLEMLMREGYLKRRID